VVRGRRGDGLVRRAAAGVDVVADGGAGIIAAPNDGEVGGGKAGDRAGDEDRAAVKFGVARADEGNAGSRREGFDDFLRSMDDGTDPGRATVAEVIGEPEGALRAGAGGEGEEGLVEQCVERDLVHPGQGVFGGQSDEAGFAEQDLDGHGVLGGQGQPQQRHVRLRLIGSRQQACKRVGEAVLTGAHPPRRMLLLEQLRRPAQQAPADAAAQPDDELAVLGLHGLLERGLTGVPGCEQLLGVGQEGGSGRGEPRSVPPAGEQRRPNK